MKLKNTLNVLFLLICLAVVAWFVYLFLMPKSTLSPAQTQSGSIFSNTSSAGVPFGSSTPTTPAVLQVFGGPQSPETKIFKVANGPVAGVVAMQTGSTTVARYIMQDSGHILDQALDTSGSVAITISNTTIPGIATVAWSNKGDTAIVQYAENRTIKTLALVLRTSTSTTALQTPNVVRFLPNNIRSISLSPDGSRAAYLLPTAAGVDGYIVTPSSGVGSKLFSLPLTQVRISWPATSTLLAQTNTATGVPGISFSISASSGTYSPLVYTSGLSALVNTTFSKLVYQTDQAERTTYIHDIASGKDFSIPYEPAPEQCVWATYNTALLFCAAPVATTPTNYLDLWHQGYGASDALFQFNAANGTAAAVAAPGSSDGGIASDIGQLALSPDGKYLLYVTRGDRSLWGVRL